MHAGPKAAEALRKIATAVERMPESVFVSVSLDGGLNLQAASQERAAGLRAYFPGTIWKKEYRPNFRWWKWTAPWSGIGVEIYGMQDAPANCKAITETRTVTRRVPVTFEEVETEETVIVGWDCDGEGEDETETTPVSEDATSGG